MARLDRINKQLGIELSTILSREIVSEKYMITITYVKCTQDLKEAKVGISVLPKKYTGTVLRELKKNTMDIVEQLKKRLTLNRIPHLQWEVDKTEREAQELDDVLEEVRKEQKEEDKE